MPARRLGKLAPRHDPRTLKMARYSTALPDPPPVCDRTDKLTDLGPMLNTELGDCTCAAIGHIIQAWTAEDGAQVILPDSDILAAYEGACGYNPADPMTDQGGVELDVLNYWRKAGVGGHRIAAYMSLQVKPSMSLVTSPHVKGLWKWFSDLGSDLDHLLHKNRNKGIETVMLPELKKQLQQAIYYFGAVYIGVELPNTAKNQPDIWDVVSITGDGAPGSWGGHAIPLLAYPDSDSFWTVTWGKKVKITSRFLAEYMTEAYPVVSNDITGDDGKSPEGFDLPGLLATLSEVTA